MKRALSAVTLLLLVALLAAGISGCATGLLHRGGPAVTTVVAGAPDARAERKTKASAERDARRAAQAEARRAARAARMHAEAEALAARDSSAPAPQAKRAKTAATTDHATTGQTEKTEKTEKHDQAGAKAAARAAKRAEQQAAREAKHAAEAAAAAAAPTARTAKKSHDEPAAVPHDALGEARVRAQQSPSEPYWPYRIAQLQSAPGFAPQAEDALRTAIARDSAYAPALTALSRLLYDQGRHEEAVQLLAPVRAHRVSMPAAERAAVLSGLAMHESALGRDDEARATLAELARDERVDAVAASAWLAVRGTENAAALELTERALRAEPKSAANHNNRGIALLRAADPDGAEREFRRAIELDPSRSGPYYNLAILERWYRLDHVAAAKHFQQYWTRSHADPDSLYAELGRAEPPVPVAEEGPNR